MIKKRWNPNVDTSILEVQHEEVDTRIIWHCIENEVDSLAIQARYTDILVLLVAHFYWMPCTKVWLKKIPQPKRRNTYPFMQ